MTPIGRPTIGVDQIHLAMRRELSTRRRVVYLLLMLGTLTAAGLIGSLWLTEPGSLPLRTQLAFGCLVVINLSWAAFCGWVLARRQVLFAAHRVIAGWMAIGFCLLFLGMGLLIAYQRGNSRALIVIAVIGAAEVCAAIVILTRAQRSRRQLLARRDELTR
jgi:hypothetical protein